MDAEPDDMAARLRVAFHEEQESRRRERQLVLFGAALASKELRMTLRDSDFADARIGGAVADASGKGTKTLVALRCLLADLGLAEWEQGDGSPLPLLVEHVRLDARLAVVWRDIASAIDSTNAAQAMSSRDKIDALERVGRIVDEAHRLLCGARETEEGETE